MIETLPTQTQALYAELLEQLLAETARKTIGRALGTFTTKVISGETYGYFQYSEPGGKHRQLYLGKMNPVLKRLRKRFSREQAEEEQGRAAIERLCSQILAGGCWSAGSAPARVLKTFAAAGVFEAGAVLVGTHAFGLIGNLLGVKWDHSHLRTEDIDLAAISILASADQSHADVPAALERLKAGFLPVPRLDPRSSSTSFKVRGKALRVDLLTPGKEDSKPVFIPRLKTEAQPLPYLDYLLENPERAAMLDSGGCLVFVPSPARFALHKVIISTRRPVIETGKVEKDVAQAAQILEHLSESRPGDIRLAADEIKRRGWVRRLSEGWRRLERQHPQAAKAASRLL